MEVKSPPALWKDFDRFSLPLDISQIKTYEEDGYNVTDLYYSALKTADGVVRVFAKLYVPAGIVNPPCIIYLNDIEKNISDKSTIMHTLGEYAFIKIDYAGNHPDRQRFTLYPQSLSHINYFENPALLKTAPKTAVESCFYVWTVMAARAATCIETLGSGIDTKKIGVLGVGEGGSTVFKVSSLPGTVSAGMTIYSFSVIDDADDKSQEYMNYKACLSAESYAPYLCAPVLEEITSNESNGSMDFMNRVYEAVKLESCRFSIVERCNRNIAAKQRKNCLYWFDTMLKNNSCATGLTEENSLSAADTNATGLSANAGTLQPSPYAALIPSDPVVTAKGSEHKLYYEITVDDRLPVSDVELFVAQATRHSAYRNWSKKKLDKISGNEYISKVPVFKPEEPVYAFVNVKYEQSLCMSSTVNMRIPQQLGVTADSASPGRLIYDSSMEFDDWLVLNDNGYTEENKLSVQEGPFGILGICSRTNSLSTFKLSDPAYAGYKECAVQILLYSPVKQTVRFKVTANHTAGKGKEFLQYASVKAVSPADNWTTISLAPADFKSQSGALCNWENAATLEVESEKEAVLISSLLWV